MTNERTYMKILIQITARISRFGFAIPDIRTLFFRREPGLSILQYGHIGSSELMSFLQFGHRIEFLFCIFTPKIDGFVKDEISSSCHSGLDPESSYLSKL